MYFEVKMRQTCVMRKTVIIEADDESSARRKAFEVDNGKYKLDEAERRRRYIESIKPLELVHHDG